VFNAPRTAFVARFIGGHNVIAQPGGAISVRSDTLRLNGAADARLSGHVTGIEFQGMHVAVAARMPDNTEVTALVPEADFFATPRQAGDAIGIDWDDAAAHRLEG
jgi:putative spermidine/putrescine transport system ATP-binding protein